MDLGQDWLVNWFRRKQTLVIISRFWFCYFNILSFSYGRFDNHITKKASYIVRYNFVSLWNAFGYKDSSTFHELANIYCTISLFGMAYYFGTFLCHYSNFNVLFNKVSYFQLMIKFASYQWINLAWKVWKTLHILNLLAQNPSSLQLER